MRYILVFILLLLGSLAVNAQTITNWTNVATPTQYAYIKDDSGFCLRPDDTLLRRAPNTMAQIRYKTSNNTFYGYYPSCHCWRPLATDSSGIIAQLNLKVDSVTVSGDSLWYWVHGVSHGYILPSAGWKLTGNLGATGNKFGTLDATDVNIYTNGVARGTFEKRGNFGWGTMFPDKIAEFTSTTSGVLFPRMTTTQRNAIGSPIAGEWLYNSTTSQWNYYNGAAWIALEPLGSDTWDDVLTNGAALLVDHAATNDGHTFSITGDNAGYRQVIRQGSDNVQGIYLKNTSNGAIADVLVSASDSSVSLRAVNGKIKMKQLTAGASTDSILSRNQITNDIHYVSRSSLFNSAPWLTEGNGGTDTSLNFIGTTDDVPLIVRVGGNKVGYLGNNDHNIIMGLETMQPLSGADENNVMGWGALQAGVSSFQNVAIGTEALKNTVDGGKSVAIGYHALRSNVSGSGSVGIGAYAGAYLIDPANTIVFNTLDQGNARGDSLNSPLVILQDGTPANSQIWLNGKLYGRYITGGSATDSVVTWSKSDSQFHKIASSSIVTAPPTLQQVTDAGNSTTNSITVTGHKQTIGLIDPDNSEAYLTTEDGTGKLGLKNSSSETGLLLATNLTSNQTYQFPDASGTIALSGSIPLTAKQIGFGNGANFMNSSADFVIDTSAGAGLAKVGINTSTPSVALDVVGDQKISGKASFESGKGVIQYAVDDDEIAFRHGDGSPIIAGYFPGADYFAFAGSSITVNNVGAITASSLTGTGTRAVLADASGVLSAPVSDRSTKQNIQSLTGGISTLMALRPVTFEYRKEFQNYGKGQQVGFIAQDIQQILPSSTYTNFSNGKMGYNEIDLVPILVKAVQEQQLLIDEMRKEIDRLKKN